MTNQLFNQTKKKKKIFGFGENTIPVSISDVNSKIKHVRLATTCNLNEKKKIVLFSCEDPSAAHRLYRYDTIFHRRSRYAPHRVMISIVLSAITSVQN